VKGNAPVSALDLVAETTQDQLERVLALQQAAHVHLHHLRQPELAFAALSRALRLSPSDPNLRTAARRAAEDADAMDGFANVLKELVSRDDLGAAKVALHRELADVQEKKLDDRHGAITQLEAVLAMEPKNGDALRALQRLLRATEHWPRLVPALDTLAGVVADPAERVALWREMALLLEGSWTTRSGLRPPAAHLRADPLNREAVSALDRLYAAMGKFENLAFALELRRAQEGQSPQGRGPPSGWPSCGGTGSRTSVARCSCWRGAGRDPGHTASLELLEGWARSHDPESRSALETLDPFLARSGQHARRVAIREARIADALSDEKIRLTQEIRSIQERDMGQPDRAFLSATAAFASNVDRPGARTDLERLARITGSYEELAQVYENVAASEAKSGSPDTVDWLRRAAELREHLAQSDEAIKDWRALLAEAPQDRHALDALGKLYEQTKNAKQFAEVVLRKAQLASEPVERRGLLIKAGESLEAATDDARAIDAYKEVLALRSGVDGLEALDRLYARARRFEEQADVLAQLAASTTGELQKGHLLRRAQLLEREKELPAAVEGYARLLAVAPNDPNAVAGLERLLELPAVRPDAARLLEPVYRSLNDVRHLVDVLELRLSGAPPNDRVPLLEEIANLREALGQRDLAFAARVRAFGEMPESAEAREQLERLAAETGAFEELAAAYQDQLERGVTNATSTELWRRLAVLWGERLERLDLAARAYEELARREPKNVQVLEALARIHGRTGDARELASVMKRMVMAEQSPPKQIDLLFRLGTLAEETLADKQLAAQCYGEVLARKQDDENAIKLLGKVLTESERWPELASLIVREIQLAEAAGRQEEMFDLMVRLGRLRLTRLRDPRGGLDIFEDVLLRKQGHAGAIGALEEMARSDSPLRGEAAEALEPIFTSGGDHLRLVQMLESRASTEPVAEERASLLRKVAKLYAGPMQNPELAFVSASRALRELPDEEASLSLAVNLAERAEGGDELAGLLEEILPRTSEDNARGAILRALAKTQETLGHAKEGIEAWRRLLELVPSDAEALGALARLYQAAGRAPELLEVYRRQLSVSEDPAVRAALLYEISGLQDGPLHDRGAMSTLRRLLELKPARRWSGWMPSARAGAGRAGRRPHPAAGAPGRRPRPRPALPPGGRPRDAASRQAGSPRALRADPRRAAEAPRGTRPAGGVDPARAAAEGRSGRAAHRLPDRGRCPEARRAPRPPHRRLARSLRAQAAPGRAGRAARGGARPGGGLHRDPPRALRRSQRRLAPTPAGAHRRSGPGPRAAGPRLRGGATPHRRDQGGRGGAPQAGRALRGAARRSGQGHRRAGEGPGAGPGPGAWRAHRPGPTLRTGGPQRPAGGGARRAGEGDPRRQRAGQHPLPPGAGRPGRAGGRGPRHRRLRAPPGAGQDAFAGGAAAGAIYEKNGP
jgi:tetratricopeptide (TPR) repeat protein